MADDRRLVVMWRTTQYRQMEGSRMAAGRPDQRGLHNNQFRDQSPDQILFLFDALNELELCFGAVQGFFGRDIFEVFVTLQIVGKKTQAEFEWD